MATSIAKKPSSKVSNLSVTRDGNKYVGKWKVPKAATSTNKDNRFTSLQMQWRLDVANSGTTDPVDTDKTGNESATQNNQTYGEFKGGKKGWGSWKGQSLARSAFYPFTGILVSSIKLRVRGKNNKGDGPWTNYATYTFRAPRAPEIKFSYNESTMVVSWTITTDEGKDSYERYDTMYRVYATRSGASNVDIVGWTNSASTKIEGSSDISTLATWSNGTVVTVYVDAYARGLAGNSGTAKNSYAVSYPPKPTINSITKDSNSRVCVSISANRDRVAEAKLQRQLNVAKGSSPAADAWSDVEGAVDNGDCAALFDVVGNATSTNGLYTWYRIKVTNKAFIDYSAAARADCLFKNPPSAEDDSCTIISATAGDDGESVSVVIGIIENNDNTGTEVSWSENPDAWKSTEQPQTFKFSWLDAQRRSQSYTKTTEVLVRGLDQGKKYYIRARRYLEGDDRTTWSPYSAASVVEPVTRPSSVALTAPAYIARGDDIECSWTFSGDSTQTSYRVIQTGSGGVEYASGDDSLGYAIIPASRYGSASSLTFFVSVSAGGQYTDSNAVSVRIADPPTCECSAAATLTAQPASFEVYSSSTPGKLLATCTSVGTQKAEPTGDNDQLPGDVVWTDAVSPSWSSSTWSSTVLYERLGDAVTAATAAVAEAQEVVDEMEEGDPGYEEALLALANAQYALADAQAALTAHPSSGAINVATVEMGNGLDFVDERGYEIECRAVDNVTGLSSGTSSTSFEIAWSHQAPAPSENIAFTPSAADRSVTIALAAPESYASGDVYDVYRKVPDGYDLVGEGLLMTDTLIDRYAPFGTYAELGYRICTRTQDGDLEFWDFDYAMNVDVLRIDFGDEFIELEYDNDMSDSYSKGFEARSHFDTRKPGGYYDGTISHTATMSTSLIRFDNAEQANLATRLASYPGSVFVRASTGAAFEANVDCTFDRSSSGAVVGMKMSVTETALTDAYKLLSVDVQEAQNG